MPEACHFILQFFVLDSRSKNPEGIVVVVVAVVNHSAFDTVVHFAKCFF